MYQNNYLVLCYYRVGGFDRAEAMSQGSSPSGNINRKQQDRDVTMDWHGKNVVIIDDERPVRWLLALLFRHHGADVQLAKDGETGLCVVRDSSPDLVILDLLLPLMNGREVLKTLRRTSNVPVVVLTSIDKGEEIVRCLDAGADDYVAKPFEGDVLLARCWSAVRRYTNPAWKRTPARELARGFSQRQTTHDVPVLPASR
jgi:DNA-binding response OmpR family regulator